MVKHSGKLRNIQNGLMNKKSTAYLKMIIDGTFNMIRIHDMYDRKFGRTRATKATKAMKKHFGKYLKGVTL